MTLAENRKDMRLCPLSLSLSLLVYINIYFVVFIFRLERSLKEEETKIKIKHRKKKRNTQRRRRCGQDKRIGALGAWIFGFQFLILIICILSSELPHRPCWLLSLRACSIVDFFSISFVSFFTFGCVLYDQLYIWNEIPSADIWLFLFSPQVLEFVFFLNKRETRNSNTNRQTHKKEGDPIGFLASSYGQVLGVVNGHIRAHLLAAREEHDHLRTDGHQDQPAASTLHGQFFFFLVFAIVSVFSSTYFESLT